MRAYSLYQKNPVAPLVEDYYIRQLVVRCDREMKCFQRFRMNVKVLFCSVTEIKKLGIHGEARHKLLDDRLLQLVMCPWRELDELAVGESDRNQPFRPP